MARLPDINSLGPRSVPQNRQGIARQDTTAVGAGIAQIGQVIGRIGEDIERRSDEQAVFEAKRKLDDWERSTIYDPENGVASKRGVDALDLPKKVPGEFDKFAGGVRETLGSNRQRKAFDEMAQARRNQIADYTVRHSLAQKEVYEKGQLNADLASSTDRATLLASNGNLSGAKAELDVAATRLSAFLKARGASGEEISAALKEHSSKTHSSAIAAFASRGDAAGAKAYLDANQSGMTQDDITRANGLLKESVARERAQAFGDEAMSSGMDMNAALAEARKRFSGSDEVAATHEIKTRFAEKEATAAMARKEITTSAWSTLMEKGSMKAIPPDMMGRLRAVAPEEERQMRDWLEAKWRRAKADAENKDVDPQVYYGLRMMAAERPEEFAKLDILKSAPYLSKQHEGHLIELQASISKNDLKAMESQRTLKRTTDMLKAEIASAGIDLTLTDKDKGSKKAQETTAFLGAVSVALDQATAAKGRPLTDEEARRIGMGMLREGIEQGSGIFGFGRTKKRGYQIATDPDIKPGASFVAATYSDIPDTYRQALVKELYPNGAPRSPYGGELISPEARAEIERMYTRGVQAGRFK